MTQFTLGPVEMDPETLEISGNPLPYFRDEGFADINRSLIRRLKTFLKTDPKTRMAMLSASGTAAMEAAVTQVFAAQDRVLVINGGTFGQRFADICRLHAIPHEILHLPPDESLTEETLSVYESQTFSGVLVNIHETSTGRLYPIETLSSFAKKKNATLVVDAVSSFMADKFEMDNWGIDVAIFSSHKSLAVAPGLAFVAINEKTWNTQVAQLAPSSLYLDIHSHIDQLERGQTPFTPAVGVIMQLHDKLCRIEEQGLEHFLCHIEVQAQHFRNSISQTNMRIPTYPLSNAQTPIILPEKNAKQIYSRLRDSYGLLVNPCGGEWADTMLRVGHMGYLNCEDNNELMHALINLTDSGKYI